jgi:hypothetical protein
LEKLLGRKYSGDLGIVKKGALKWILHRRDVDSIHLAQNSRPVAGSCEDGNELAVFMKGKEFPDKLRELWLFKES